jgi:CRP/FNR family transcriptional regulator, cyclic AMP receptor protein
VSSLRKLRHGTEALVLQADPGLASEVVASERSRAIEASRAPVRVFSPGEWVFAPAPDRLSLGALVLMGMLVLRVEFGECSHLEVLGQGDVINPWLLGSETTLQEQISVHVMQSGAVALLDGSFAVRMRPWPEVFAALMRRQVMRTRRMVLQASILSRPRVDERLELMLWRLADQFGSMTREGLLVRLPFTHLELAEMIAARRSTVTLAVGRLLAEDRIRRPARNQWLLPRQELTRLAAIHADQRLQPA